MADNLEEIEDEQPQINYSIKGNSKFNKYFRDIRVEVQKEIDEKDLPKKADLNAFHCKKIIDHLEEKFMPYYFVWGSLVLKDTEWTRMNNGRLETHQGFLKRKAPKDVLPHKHLISNYPTISGIASGYLTSIGKQIEKNKSNKNPNKRNQLPTMVSMKSQRVTRKRI